MPPKKENPGADGNTLVVGFEDKETKLLAAAFLSSVGPDKYDYDLMATLTGNTAGSLKKMWPPVKRKAIDAHLSFAKFLGSEGGNAAAVPKATGGRKRKATADVDGEDVDSKSAEDKSDSANKSDGKAKTKKKAPAAKPKSRPAKKTKKEVKEEEDSADGGDGMDAEEDVEGED